MGYLTMKAFKTRGAELFHPPVALPGKCERWAFEADAIDSSWAPLDALIEMPAGSTMRYDPDPLNRYAPANPFAVTSLTHRRGTY